MGRSGGTVDEGLGEIVVEEMMAVKGPTSLDEIVEETQIEDREHAKTVMRELINDGMVSTTPEWEYKLATRLRR